MCLERLFVVVGQLGQLGHKVAILTMSLLCGGFGGTLDIYVCDSCFELILTMCLNGWRTIEGDVIMLLVWCSVQNKTRLHELKCGRTEFISIILSNIAENIVQPHCFYIRFHLCVYIRFFFQL